MPDIEVSAPVTKFLPRYPKLQNVLIFDLLNQTSGLAEYLYGPTESELCNWSLDDCCDFIVEQEISSGKTYQYSNSNFVILTKIIEVAADTTYSHYVRSMFFSPIGMESTTIRKDFYDGFQGWGDASIHSCVEDLQKWYQSDQFRGFLDRLNNLNGDYVGSYVGGLFRQKDGYYFHSGSKPGYGSFALQDPSTDSSFVLLCEFDPAPEMMDSIHDLFGAS